jgi:hypothetical protein
MKYLILLIIFIVCISCEPNKKDGVNAGIINSNMTYEELNPTMQISNLGKDSLDLDKDSEFDIVFIKSPIALLTGFAIKTEIIKKANIQVIISELNNYPDSLNYNDLINDSRNWSGFEEKKYVLQSFDCNSNTCPSIGNFINVTNKYIGFKIGSSFGWIELDNGIWTNLIIKGFAITK